jgi:hypothetical protein
VTSIRKDISPVKYNVFRSAPAALLLGRLDVAGLLAGSG